MVKASQSDKWYSYEGVPFSGNCVYDAGEIGSVMNRFMRMDAQHFNLLSEHQILHLKVCYETFIESHETMESVSLKILTEARVPCNQHILDEVRLQQQADEQSHQWENRFLKEELTCEC